MITEIAESFYRITLPMPFRLRHVHAYALIDGTNVALFDTGMQMPSAFERLEADLQSIGYSIKSISDIYLTHGHTDHCGMSGTIQKKSNALRSTWSRSCSSSGARSDAFGAHNSTPQSPTTAM